MQIDTFWNQYNNVNIQKNVEKPARYIPNRYVDIDYMTTSSFYTMATPKTILRFMQQSTNIYNKSMFDSTWFV